MGTIKNNDDGRVAGVDDQNNLQTIATTKSQDFVETTGGNFFVAHTGIISLTTASESAIFYFKNNETINVNIIRMICSSGFSKELSGTPNTNSTYQLKVATEPKTPTFTTVTKVVNALPGSGKDLTVDSFEGVEGSSFASQDNVLYHDLLQHGQRIDLNLSTIVLEPGRAIGILITPPTGNSTGNDAMKIHFALLAFKHEHL